MILLTIKKSDENSTDFESKNFCHWHCIYAIKARKFYASFMQSDWLLKQQQAFRADKN